MTQIKGASAESNYAELDRKAEIAARTTLAAELDARGPTWADLADAIEEGRNYANDTIHVDAAIKALATVFRDLLVERGEA